MTDCLSQLISISRELVDDDDINIREITYSNFQSVLDYGDAVYERSMTDIIEIGIDKGPDFVTAIAVQHCCSLARLNKPVATSILKTLSGSSFWRVRYSICLNIQKIGEIFGEISFKTFLTKNLSDYLLDQKSETKIGALDCLPKACRFIDQESISGQIAPCLSHLVNDSDLSVVLL